MNISLFHSLHSLAYLGDISDLIIVFTAEYLFFLFALFAGVIFLYRWLEGRGILFRDILFIFSTPAVGWLVGNILKIFFHVSRPFVSLSNVHPLFLNDVDFAFPSGHTVFAFALSATLFRHNRLWGFWAYSLAIVQGTARIIAGVHWPADIVGGAVIGIGVVLLADLIDRKLFQKEKPWWRKWFFWIRKGNGG